MNYYICIQEYSLKRTGSYGLKSKFLFVYIGSYIHLTVKMDPKYSLDAVLNMLDTVEEVEEEIEIATTPVEEVIANSINIILNSQNSNNENDVSEDENLDDDPNDKTYMPTSSESEEDFYSSEQLNNGKEIDHEDENIINTNNVTSENILRISSS